MKVYQILHIKYCLDKKTMKPIFGKGFFAEQQGYDHQYSAPIRCFKTKSDVKEFLLEEQKNILWWNKKRTLHTNKLTNNCLRVEFEPKGNGYPCEMYQAVSINLPDDFIDSTTFSKSGR